MNKHKEKSSRKFSEVYEVNTSNMNIFVTVFRLVIALSILIIAYHVFNNPPKSSNSDKVYKEDTNEVIFENGEELLIIGVDTIVYDKYGNVKELRKGE